MISIQTAFMIGMGFGFLIGIALSVFLYETGRIDKMCGIKKDGDVNANN